MSGPGYRTPLEAMMNGPKEEILYVCCIQPNPSEDKSDYLATVDVNPESPAFCQVIHRLHTGKPNDELHHSGWNVCSSCHGCCKAPVRDKLFLPCLGSDRVLIVDTGKDPRAPKLHKVLDSSEMHKFNCATPHTSHCLPTGEVMISTLGDVEGNGKGDFVLIDTNTLEMKGTWTVGKTAEFGYDFWYQPYHDTLVASEWGAPKVFKKGFNSSEKSGPHDYGSSLNFYSWSTRELKQTINMGLDGFVPLEVRFLHNPKEPQGYVAAAARAKVFRFYKKEDGTWDTHLVIDVKQKKVEGWSSPYLQGMMTDIVISLDDKYLYFNNWWHGDIRQYDISDRCNPKLTGQIFLGGKILSDSAIKVIDDPELDHQPDPVYVKGKRLHGGPQMMQLSLDGKRLYVSNSLFSPWDKHFYPDMIEHGSYIVKLNVDTENGGLTLDPDFLVDFSEGPDGPTLAHEMRYPGGDCTSDIWIVDDEKKPEEKSSFFSCTTL